jgi:hypothetical protein
MKKDAHACPHCGSDETTGWSPHTYLDGINMQDETSYEEIRQNEFGDGRTLPYRKWVILTALLVLAAIIAGMFSLLR